MSRLVFLILLLSVPQAVNAQAQRRRTISGHLYFTNDTPRNRDTFPVELFTRDRRRRVAAGRADANGDFRLTGIRPGKYILKLTWPPDICELWYRADVTKESKERITIVMDAACSGGSRVRDLPTN
jgi:hypothetical protein